MITIIRGLILYYLNIKATHGYEIQRFIQLSGIDNWAKIQSGSIYYALSKLEKEKNIEILKEEVTGSRVRKIYQITDQGKETLHKEMIDSLAMPLVNVGSTKFITQPMLNTLSKDEMTGILTKHIEELKKQKEFWETWETAKAGEDAPKLNQISFHMTIDSIQNQIKWHDELLNHLDFYINDTKSMDTFIRNFDADKYETNSEESQSKQSIEFINSVKETLKKDPKMLESLNKIIEELKNHS